MNANPDPYKPVNRTDISVMPPVRLLPTALSELYISVSCSGCLTLADRYGLMAALLDESLPEEELAAIDRLLYAVRKRRLTIVDEISLLL